MNPLEKQLFKLNPSLHSKLLETIKEVRHLLTMYVSNFPTYTDHSSLHTEEVFIIASEVLTDEEINELNADEIYVLSMACYLHDIGMCIPENKISEIAESDAIVSYKKSHPNLSAEDFIRDIHHELSNKFINDEWEILKIPSKKYAEAIGLVCQGHRKVELGDFNVFNPVFFVKSGKEFVCLPYLAAILRLADELDVTNSRTPRILTKYYMPNNEVSVREWKKHIATSQRNYLDNKVIFEVNCTDQNIYAALQEQFDKIQNVINYCQKVRRAIPANKSKTYNLNLSLVEPKYNFIGFDPKGIKFSFDVQNVVTAFIGEDLYKDKLTSIREVLQNSIDTCRYKKQFLKENYEPKISVSLGDGYIEFEDNGTGMDEFIVENFFGRLASSFYEQEKIKTEFEAIGQFGVGVFSYFLISEYIDIETKTISNPAIRFRFDKDPKSYFHFYDNPQRTTPGTKITMYLRKDIDEDITFTQLEEYVKKIFRYIEIPIELNNKSGDQIVIVSQSLEINVESEIKERLMLQHRKQSKLFDIKPVYIEDSEMEGYCGIILGGDPQKAFSYGGRYLDDLQFASIDRTTLSEISISQKGVFVNYYSSPTLNFIVGNINLKKKIRINIDRNEFSDGEQVSKYIHRFECKILKTFFNSTLYQSYNRELRYEMTEHFLRYYTDYPLSEEKEYIEVFRSFIYVNVCLGETSLILNIEEILDKHSEIIVICNIDIAKSISRQFNMPVILTSSDNYSQLQAILTNLINFVPVVYFIDNQGFEFLKLMKQEKSFIINLTSIYEIGFRHITSIVRMNSLKVLACNVWNQYENDYDEFEPEGVFINYDHPFIQYLISNISCIKSDNLFRKIIRSALQLISQIVDQDKSDEISIQELNEILKPLNKISKLKKITSSDFIQRKI